MWERLRSDWSDYWYSMSWQQRRISSNIGSWSLRCRVDDADPDQNNPSARARRNFQRFDFSLSNRGSTTQFLIQSGLKFWPSAVWFSSLWIRIFATSITLQYLRKTITTIEHICAAFIFIKPRSAIIFFSLTPGIDMLYICWKQHLLQLWFLFV